MLEVKFYDAVDDALLRFAVIISQSNGKWVLCKHKERDTYEVPGGHREAGEDILETAKRELQEEDSFIIYSSIKSGLKYIVVDCVFPVAVSRGTCYNIHIHRENISRVEEMSTHTKEKMDVFFLILATRYLSCISDRGA